MQAFEGRTTAIMIQFMARRADNRAGTRQPSAGAASLRILDWDEGLSPQSWFGVEITYRQQYQPVAEREAARLDLDLPYAGNPKNHESHF
jgi:hypothetical protein